MADHSVRLSALFTNYQATKGFGHVKNVEHFADAGLNAAQNDLKALPLNNYKALWGKGGQEMLMTSIFSFSHNAFISLYLFFFFSLIPSR